MADRFVVYDSSGQSQQTIFNPIKLSCQYHVAFTNYNSAATVDIGFFEPAIYNNGVIHTFLNYDALNKKFVFLKACTCSIMFTITAESSAGTSNSIVAVVNPGAVTAASTLLVYNNAFMMFTYTFAINDELTFQSLRLGGAAAKPDYQASYLDIEILSQP